VMVDPRSRGGDLQVNDGAL